MKKDITSGQLKWDIRATPELMTFYNSLKPRGPYFYKLGLEDVKTCVSILANAYGVICPKVVVNNSGVRRMRARAFYNKPSHTINMCTRNHIKTIFHEFYHHLEEVTNGIYRSGTAKASEHKYSHQFADILYDDLRQKIKDAKPKAIQITITTSIT
jgi:hypothetical protein